MLRSNKEKVLLQYTQRKKAKIMWKNYSSKGYYYDEQEDITYINNDRLTEEEMVELIGILGFMLDTSVDNEEYLLVEVRHGEGDLFEETFATIKEAYNRLEAHFDPSLYEFVTDEIFNSIKEEAEVA